MIQRGHKVSIEYTGKFEDGRVFETSQHGDHSHPMEFVVGQGQVIGAIEQGVVGLQVGNEKDIIVTPDEGYGSYDPSAIKRVPRSQFPPDIQEGLQVVVEVADGQKIPTTVVKVEPEFVTLDLNHPLAGKVLYFHIKVVGVQ